MVTYSEMMDKPNGERSYDANGKSKPRRTCWGKRTDTKPTDCGNGSTFIEMDTGKIYFYDAAGEEWLEWGA